MKVGELIGSLFRASNYVLDLPMVSKMDENEAIRISSLMKQASTAIEILQARVSELEKSNCALAECGYENQNAMDLGYAIEYACGNLSEGSKIYVTLEKEGYSSWLDNDDYIYPEDCQSLSEEIINLTDKSNETK